ncbi:unnamed protein product [Rotaria sp. Silwood1]|nr:unnamed protein product [Rotaria sp. Silwood1]CAF3488851.1 unnamed protein product [Rotaria sp. Silwood1]CAF3557437.1 unnamed protein product [Rotaria sp. Silwood1]CAF3561519.1 unnamed protein product [Rotaria sp. Silwood1]CAF4852844.1 unnamed protein product [Rotaria sp. Silwood1]
MTTRPNTVSTNLSSIQRRQHKLTKKSARHTERITPIRIDIRRSETTLSPNDELECRQMYEKLQRLQPNGVCVNLNTLRRALFPPISLPKTSIDQLLTFKTYRQHTDEIPRIRTYDVPKQTKVNKIDYMNIDRIINQVNQHAAINYSYYTRTK